MQAVLVYITFRPSEREGYFHIVYLCFYFYKVSTFIQERTAYLNYKVTMHVKRCIKLVKIFLFYSQDFFSTMKYIKYMITMLYNYNLL